MTNKHAAVLIADVVKSSSLHELRLLLGQKLAAASREHLKRKWIRLPYSVTAGDEFQTIGLSQANIPELILDLRIRLLPLNLRIGVGFGAVPVRVEPPVNRMGGPAFVLARAALESLKRKFTVCTTRCSCALPTSSGKLSKYSGPSAGWILQRALLMWTIPQCRAIFSADISGNWSKPWLACRR
jgi:hypothetical protein